MHRDRRTGGHTKKQEKDRTGGGKTDKCDDAHVYSLNLSQEMKNKLSLEIWLPLLRYSRPTLSN